jgi:hypothetical protein
VLGKTPPRSSPVSPSADRSLLDALAAVQVALDDLGAPAMIIGGIAVVARGIPRLTRDIDATVWGEGLDVDHVLERLAAHQILPRISDAASFARQHQVFLLRHGPSGTPIELTLAWLPFEEEALARATDEPFADLSIRVVRPEDLIVFKAVAWREQDRADVERLLLRYGQAIDLDRVRDLVRQFAEVLEEPERIAAFETIVSRALGRER